MEFTAAEQKILNRLTSPVKIQDYLQQLDIHFQDRYWSPSRVMREGRAQCFEGAVFAAMVLERNDEPPLIMDLKSLPEDREDHIVALFQRRGRWGAISKTNHAVLRYREPIFKDLHALAASYFHEYFLNNGRKTLVSYSTPLNLRRFRHRHWQTSETNLDYIVKALDQQKHWAIAPKGLHRELRRADPIEIRVGKIVEHKRH